jgi:hypothetical protein
MLVEYSYISVFVGLEATAATLYIGISRTITMDELLLLLYREETLQTKSLPPTPKLTRPTSKTAHRTGRTYLRYRTTAMLS